MDLLTNLIEHQTKNIQFQCKIGTTLCLRKPKTPIVNQALRWNHPQGHRKLARKTKNFMEKISTKRGKTTGQDMGSDWQDSPGQEKMEILRWRPMSRNGWKGLSQVSLVFSGKPRSTHRGLGGGIEHSPEIVACEKMVENYILDCPLKGQKAQSKNMGTRTLPGSLVPGIWNSDRDRESNKMEASLCLHSEKNNELVK